MPCVVPQAHPGPADELDRVADVRRDRVVALELLELGERRGHCDSDFAGTIRVPCPASVNSSSSSECGTRPSTMCANETPPWIASTAARSFGRIPPETVESAASTSSAVASEMTLPGSAGIAQPAGDVGQEHELVRAQRPRDRAGRLVGVDVVRVALAVGADARDDRDVVLGDVVEHVDVDPLDPADVADVLAARRRLAAGPEQQAVVAATARRRAGRGG